MHANLKLGKGAIALLAAMAFVVTAVACASVDQGAARREIGGAETAISQAQAGGALEHAPLELRTAQDKLAAANGAFDDGDYKKAEYLAQEAVADARLAGAKADTETTQGMVQALRESIGDLRQEIERTTTTQ